MTTNLSGSLSEFSLAEVLSLLGMGGRTARMQVTSADAVGTVHLVDGRISSATADSARAGLLRGVVAALSVPADDLAQALQSEDPVRALVESGVVDREAAQQVASEHCTEAVGEMLDWTSGEFAVWVGSQDPADIGVRLDVDELVAAARERAQEWHDLRAALPESDSVLALVPDVAQAPVVDVEDWAVLARVDGRRTLTEVLAAMGASPLAAGNRLVQLMGRGLVAVRVGGGDAEREHISQMLDAFDAAGPVRGGRSSWLPSRSPSRSPTSMTCSSPSRRPSRSGRSPLWIPGQSRRAEPVVGSARRRQCRIPSRRPAEEYAASERVGGPRGPRVPGGTGAGARPRAFRRRSSRPPLRREPVAFAAEPVTFERGAEAVTVRRRAGGASSPIAHEPAWTSSEPVADVVRPRTSRVGVLRARAGVVRVRRTHVRRRAMRLQEASRVTFDLEPVAEPVGESFAWSPWAQEMGLGEAPVVADAAAGVLRRERLRRHGRGCRWAWPHGCVPGPAGARRGRRAWQVAVPTARRSTRSRSSCHSRGIPATGWSTRRPMPSSWRPRGRPGGRGVPGDG